MSFFLVLLHLLVPGIALAALGSFALPSLRYGLHKILIQILRSPQFSSIVHLYVVLVESSLYRILIAPETHGYQGDNNASDRPADFATALAVAHATTMPGV